jgi:biopolymer transport protein ExbD
MSARPVAPTFRVEVAVRKAGLEILDGSQIIAAIPKKGGAYDLQKLSEYLVAIKQEHPAKEDASVLLEPDIEYDHLIEVMDTVRSVETKEDGETVRTSLYPVISIGDAP